MNNHYLKKIDLSNYCFFFIKDRGLKYTNEILEILISNKNKFNLMMILKYEKKFLNNYNFFSYLKLTPEIKFLLKKSKKGMFIFTKFKNDNHIHKAINQSTYIKNQVIAKYQKIIRNKFDLNQSELKISSHTFYGCSNGHDAHYVLKYLGYNNGLQILNRHENKPFKVSYFIENFNQCKIHEIQVDDLICNTILRSSIDIKESPQYKFLLGSENEYKNYIEKYLGIKLLVYHSIQKYRDLLKNFKYLGKENETSYVIVKKVNGKYMIIDGLHRASLSIYKKKSKLIVLEIL